VHAAVLSAAPVEYSTPYILLLGKSVHQILLAPRFSYSSICPDGLLITDSAQFRKKALLAYTSPYPSSFMVLILRHCTASLELKRLIRDVNHEVYVALGRIATEPTNKLQLLLERRRNLQVCTIRCSFSC
jgi:hypothetical protein